MPEETATPAPPKHKFEVGQTVYKADKSRHSGGVRLEGHNEPILLTKTTVEAVDFKSSKRGWGEKAKTVFTERVRLAQSWTMLTANRAYVWTEAQYAEVKDEYEAALAARDDSKMQAVAQRGRFVAAFLAFASEHPDEAIGLVTGGVGLQVGREGTSACSVCWTRHASYRTYDHEEAPVK